MFRLWLIVGLLFIMLVAAGLILLSSKDTYEVLPLGDDGSAGHLSDLPVVRTDFGSAHTGVIVTSLLAFLIVWIVGLYYLHENRYGS